MQYDNTHPSTDLPLREYLLILRRRRGIILLTFVLVSLVSLIITFRTKSVYQASAQLMVDGPSNTMSTVDTGNPLSSLLAPRPALTISTQAMVLQTHRMLDELAKTKINPADIKVAELPGTNIIQIDAEAGDPYTAAAAPNALMDLYVQQSADANKKELTTAYAFVRDQKKKADRELIDSESALRDFSTNNHIADLGKNRDEEIGRVEKLKSDLQQQQIDLASTQSGLKENRRLLSQEPVTLMVYLKTTNTLVAALQSQISALEVDRDAQVNVSGAWTPRSPYVVGLNKKISVLKRRLVQQPPLIANPLNSVNAVRATLHTRITELETQEAQLTAQGNAIRQKLAQTQNDLRRFASLQMTLARLNRTHDDAVDADKAFLKELNDLALRRKMQHQAVSIMERARPPQSPIRPNKKRDILLACLVGLFAGICLGLLQEYMDDRITSGAEANRLLGLTTLGRIPVLTVDEKRFVPGPGGLKLMSESYRILRHNLYFSSVDAPIRTLLVTSPSPSEGKSTTAANLALALALDGKKVILVDADLRRPSLHTRLSMANLSGMTDILLGTASIDDVLLEHSEQTGLMALLSGAKPPNPSELINSRAFGTFLNQLSKEADVVVFDSSPLLAAADAQILASQVDGVILVIEIGATKKAAAREAIAMLNQARANCLGAVYNRVNLTDSGYYAYQHYLAPEATVGTLPVKENINTAQSLLTPFLQGRIKPVILDAQKLNVTEADKPKHSSDTVNEAAESRKPSQ